MNSKWNYIDFVLVKDQESERLVNVDIGKHSFLELLDYFSRSFQKKMFSRNIIRYFFNDLVYEVCNKEIKTFQKQPINILKSKTMLKLFYFKEKVHYCAFPSTKDIHEVHNISSIIFRFHNNIYMNFDVISYPKDKMKDNTYKVYLNYNHDSNTDSDYVQKIMSDIQTQICSTGFHLANFEL